MEKIKDDIKFKRKITNLKDKARNTIIRWQKTKAYSVEEFYILQLKFRNFKYNIYLLNRSALKIQHHYFKWKAGLFVIKMQNKKQNKIAKSKTKITNCDNFETEELTKKQIKLSKNHIKIANQPNSQLKNVISRNITEINKSQNKSRNGSKKSLNRYDSREMKTFVSVLENRKHAEKRLLNKSNEIYSPEENSEKVKSDKVYKSSLTSSTTTHTNNAKNSKINEDYSKKRNSSCYDTQINNKKQNSKII